MTKNSISKWRLIRRLKQYCIWPNWLTMLKLRPNSSSFSFLKSTIYKKYGPTFGILSIIPSISNKKNKNYANSNEKMEFVRVQMKQCVARKKHVVSMQVTNTDYAVATALFSFVVHNQKKNQFVELFNVHSMKACDGMPFDLRWHEL